MNKWLKELDRLLRGDATRISALRYGSIEIPVAGFLLVIVVLGLFYGLCMACYAMFNGADAIVLRLIATMLKVPTLFILTLAITFPSLYIFNSLVGSRLTMESVLQLLISALAVMMAVLASLGPIVAFFSVSTTSQPFMLLLNVAIFTVAGALGLRFMLRTLQRLALVQTSMAEETPEGWIEKDFDAQLNGSMVHSEMAGAVDASGAEEEEPGFRVLEREEEIAEARQRLVALSDRKRAKPKTDPKVQLIFRIWVMVFGLVGSQLSWVMRPFIGGQNQTFQWFGPRESSFFDAIFHAIGKLL